MLQKIENVYLMILRVVVIVIAGLLLVTVVILGLNSFKALQPEPKATNQTPQVSEQEIIKGITSKPASVQEPSSSNAAAEQVDPNKIYYERAATAIGTFVAKYSGGMESAERTQVIAITRNHALEQGDPELVAAYAKNFAETIEKTLANPAVISAARSSSTINVVNKALNLFTQDFRRQVAKKAAEDEEKKLEYLQKKADGTQSLYMAAGSFGAFLLIVFLSIFIKIERNLRNIQVKPSGSA